MSSMMHVEDLSIYVNGGRFVVVDPFMAGKELGEFSTMLAEAIEEHNPGNSGVTYAAFVRTDVVPDSIKDGFKISPLFKTSKRFLARMEHYNYPVFRGARLQFSRDQITKTEADLEGILVVYLVDEDTGEVALEINLNIDRREYEINSLGLDIDEDNAREMLRIINRILEADTSEFYA